MALSEEEIRGTGKNRLSWGFFVIGIAVVVIGYVVYDVHINHYSITQTGRKVLVWSEYPLQPVGLFVIIIGIVIISIGIIKKLYSRI
jgi:hypothetical protein